jgi:hypothetical protein
VARALAAEKLLDRGYGKPPQLNTADAGLFRRARDMSDDELAAIIQRAPPMLALQALPVPEPEQPYSRTSERR